MNERKMNKKTMGILAGLLLMSCFCIFYRYLFGGYALAFRDIGSDTYDQYMMHYQTIINHLREGSFSLWDFNNGFGINMFSLNLFDPFLMILYLAGVILGPSSVYGVMVYLQILKIVLAGICGYCFLSCFALSERSKLLTSYAYALCGFMVVWGQHYQFGTVMIMYPLLLMAAEKAMKKTRWFLGLTILCALDSIISFYMSYMQFIVLGVYILLRTAWNGKFFSVESMKKIGKFYGSMLLGIGMGLFSLLPSAAMIFGVSGRMDGAPLFEKILASLNPWNEAYYKILIKRFFSSNLGGITSYTGATNYYEDPNVFLSALLIFCGAQFLYFLFKKNYTIRQRLLLILSAGLLGTMLLIPLGSLIFNGFAYPFSRHTYLCMPFFVWMMADTLDEILERRKLCIPIWFITLLGVEGVYLWCFIERRHAMIGNGAKLAALLGLMAAAMAVSAGGAALLKKESVRRILNAGLALSLMGTMLLDSYYSYNMDSFYPDYTRRYVVEKAPSEYMDELYSPSVAQALEEIAAEDDSFYRVEKDYRVGVCTSCLNSLAQNYAGVSTYNSTLNKGSMQYLQNFWPNLEIGNNAHYSFANAVNDDFQASLNHVKYVLSRKSDLQVRGYELFRQVGDIYIFRNTHTQELGKFYTSAFTAADYEAVKDSLDQEALLSENIICDTVSDLTQSGEKLNSYQRICVAQEEEIIQGSDDGTSVVLKLPQTAETSGTKYLMEFDLSLPQPMPEVMVEAGNHSTQYLVGPDPVHARVTIPEGCSEVRIFYPYQSMNDLLTVQNRKLYVAETTDLSSLSQGVHIEPCQKDSIVKGTANVRQDGVLMLSIPYENGWHAYVDGEEVTVHQVNYGFSGIRLAAGDHEIKMEYRCPGFLSGVAASIFFALLTAVIWGGLWVRKKHRNL